MKASFQAAALLWPALTSAFVVPVPVADAASSSLHPKADVAAVAGSTFESDVSKPDILSEFQKLEDYKVQIKALIHGEREHERHILHMLKQDFRECEGLLCVVHTAVEKAPDFARLLAEHFWHRPLVDAKHATDTHQNCSRASVEGLPEHGTVQYDELDGMADPPFIDIPEPALPLSSPEAPERPVAPDVPRPPEPPIAPVKEEHPPHGPPAYGPHGHHGHHPLFPHRHRRHPRMLKIVAIVLFTTLIAACLFRHIRRNCNQQRCADRAARREARRTRRAYRRAACKHRWSQWWSQCRLSRSRPTPEHDEKRQLVVHQESALEDVMQDEIRSIRTAHEIVGDMISGELRRSQLYHELNSPPSRRRLSPAELEAGLGNSRSPYFVPPPQYEEELDSEITVVDGLQYTPNGTDNTPDSSVVDCSPRMSVETGSIASSKGSRD